MNDRANPRWLRPPPALAEPWMRARRRVARIPRTAAVMALLGILASDTPSLLPRPWYFQGFISGITAVVFCAFGSLLEDIAGWAGLTVRVNDTARRVLKVVGIVLLVLAALLYPAFNLVWHSMVTFYFNEPQPGPLYPVLSLLVALVVTGVSSASSG